MKVNAKLCREQERGYAGAHSELVEVNDPRGKKETSLVEAIYHKEVYIVLVGRKEETTLSLSREQRGNYWRLLTIGE